MTDTVLESGLSVGCASHFSSGRMFYADEFEQLFWNIQGLLSMRDLVHTKADICALNDTYGGAFIQLPRVCKDALNTTLRSISRD
jgi:hypothetical protein